MRPARHRSIRDRKRLRVRWAACGWSVPLRKAGCRLPVSGLAKSGDLCSLLMLSINHEVSSTMKNPSASRPASAGFTLIELLVVISIIGVLAGLIFPALTAAQTKARKAKAQVEMKGIEQAIMNYEADHHRLPASPRVVRATGDGTTDYTYGTWHQQDGQTPVLLRKGGNPKARELEPIPARDAFNYIAGNAELMFILRDVEKWPTSTGGTFDTVNVDHQLNPKRQSYLDLTPASATTRPGLGPDGVYRDPWGNPYVISLDMNGDDRCLDAFYGRQAVSGKPGDPSSPMGLNGLTSTVTGGNPGNTFELTRQVMVWSLGPDGAADPNQSANKGANKDNVLSWQ